MHGLGRGTPAAKKLPPVRLQLVVFGLSVLAACDPLPSDFETDRVEQAIDGADAGPTEDASPPMPLYPDAGPADAGTPEEEETPDAGPSAPLPPRCVLAPGTQQGSAEWLEWWRCNARDFCDIGDLVNSLGSCPREIDLGAIQDACDDYETRAQRFQCVMQKVHEAVEALEAADRAADRYVCRHYSACANKVLDRMGDRCNFEGGSVIGHGGHAWCEVTDNETGGTLVGDPYNEICYWVPREGRFQRVCRFIRIGR